MKTNSVAATGIFAFGACQPQKKTQNKLVKEKQMYNNESPDNDKTPIYDKASSLRAVTPLELISRASDVCMQKGNHHLLAAEDAVEVYVAMEHLSIVEMYADKVHELQEHANKFMKDFGCAE